MYGFKNETNLFTNYEFETHSIINEKKLEEISETIAQDFGVSKIEINFNVKKYLI